MKRIAALVLAMILLAAQSASACAAVRPLRFLVNDNGEVSAWLKEHAPDIPHENLHFDYDYSPGDFDSLTDRLLDELQSEDGPDLYLLDSNAYDLARVLESGLLEDLSGDAEIRACRFRVVRAVSASGERRGWMHLRHVRKRPWRPDADRSRRVGGGRAGHGGRTPEL